jgi:hypothetical protein
VDFGCSRQSRGEGRGKEMRGEIEGHKKHTCGLRASSSGRVVLGVSS